MATLGQVLASAPETEARSIEDRELVICAGSYCPVETLAERDARQLVRKPADEH